MINDYRNSIVLLLSLVVVGCGNSAPKPKTESRVYSTMTVVPESSNVGTYYPASLRGKQDIEIRPRVTGYITEVCVDEGAVVKKGSALFKLDPVPYQEAYSAAKAQVKTLEANSNSNLLTYQSKKELADRGVIGQTELKAAQYAMQASQGQLEAAKAQVVSAKNDLSYTIVVSPSDGVVGSIPYRTGSLVSGTMVEPLTIVSEIHEIYAYFAVSEKELLGFGRTAGNQAMADVIKNMPQVELILADGTKYSEKGAIKTVSGMIDQKSGAVTFRAAFPNKGLMLRSGGSGKVRVPSVLDSVIVIPQRSSYELQDMRYVYTLTDSLTAHSTPIRTSDMGDGKQFIVLEGLNFGDKIIVDGIGTLRDGMKIEVKE